MVDQGYTGGGKTWIEEQLGRTAEVVRNPQTLADLSAVRNLLEDFLSG